MLLIIRFFVTIIVLGILVYFLYTGRIPFLSRRGGASHTNSTRFNGQSRQEAAGNRKSEEPFDPYKILGLQRGASQEEIHQAYRLASQRYHPDKVSHLGEEFQELARKKFLEIQKAYEMLRAK